MLECDIQTMLRRNVWAYRNRQNRYTLYAIVHQPCQLQTKLIQQIYFFLQCDKYLSIILKNFVIVVKTFFYRKTVGKIGCFCHLPSSCRLRLRAVLLYFFYLGQTVTYSLIMFCKLVQFRVDQLAYAMIRYAFRISDAATLRIQAPKASRGREVGRRPTVPRRVAQALYWSIV